MKGVTILLVILVQGVELKFSIADSDSIARNLVNYNSVKIKLNHDKIHDYHPETVYYSPFQVMAKAENFTKTLKKSVQKRGADATFRGKQKTIQVQLI